MIMKVEKNVGTIDALVRITLGLTGLAWSTAKMVRRRGGTGAGLIALLSAMKVAEGTTRFCPMLAYFGVNSLSLDGVMGNENRKNEPQGIGNGGSLQKGENGEGKRPKLAKRNGAPNRSIRARLRRVEKEGGTDHDHQQSVSHSV